jgi:hypothetical protein
MLRGETPAPVRAGFMDSPDDRKRAALHAKRIGGLLVQASVSLSQTNDSVSAR